VDLLHNKFKDLSKVLELLWNCFTIVLVLEYTAKASLVRFVVDLLWTCSELDVDLLYNLLYDKTTANRTSGV
jgi:hypothetical protein